MYKDTVVLSFDTDSKSVEFLNEDLLPLSVFYRERNYDIVRKFCSDRVLVLNRSYCKEILLACGIESQDDVSICIACKGLSFRDNYWIKESNSSDTWESVNLYTNTFSTLISRTALTGEMDSDAVLDDKVFTGELTSKGTRAKCFVRDGDKLYLYKNETVGEIASEIISFYIARAFKLPASKYVAKKLYGKECSVCQIATSEDYELIPCRDIMSMYNCAMNYDTDYYGAFMALCGAQFVKMQIFDYITLNSDRNRDNFGILRYKGKLVNIYPLFDHDSCFKSKSVDGLYFPTGMSFKQTLNLLKTEYSEIYATVVDDIKALACFLRSNDFKNYFTKYKTIEEYNSMLVRLNDL